MLPSTTRSADSSRLGVVASLGLTTQDIGDTIQTAIEGSVPTQLQRGERLVDIRVQLNEEALQRAFSWNSCPVCRG